MGEEFFRSSGKIGITKIALLAGLTEDERAALQEKADIESATVRELKEQISQLRGELDEKEQRIGELEWNASAAGLTAPDNAAELEKAEQAAQAARAEAAAAKADATKLKERVEALKKDKQALEEKLKSPAVQTIENPETEAERDRALAAIAEKDAEIERLQKQLMIAGDAKLTEFKVKFGELQSILSDMASLLGAMDEANSAKCRAAVRSILEESGL